MKPIVIAAALTWDGACVPIQTLPATARAFLREGKTALPSAKKMTELFATNSVKEIRLCWMPQLRGGKTLADPFVTAGGMRIPFRVTQWKRFGDILGVVYRL